MVTTICYEFQAIVPIMVAFEPITNMSSIVNAVCDVFDFKISRATFRELVTSHSSVSNNFLRRVRVLSHLNLSISVTSYKLHWHGSNMCIFISKLTM